MSSFEIRFVFEKSGAIYQNLFKFKKKTAEFAFCKSLGRFTDSIKKIRRIGSFLHQILRFFFDIS